MKTLITSKHLYYTSLLATLAILIVSFTHIALAVIAFEQKSNQWVSLALAGGTELFLTLTGFGVGEIIKYKASQATAKYAHSNPIFPTWMLAVMITGLMFFSVWLLWGNFYYVSVVAVNETVIKKTNIDAAWVNIVTWEQLKSVDKFYLFNSYMAAIPIPIMAFMGSILQTIFGLAAQREGSNSTKGVKGTRVKKNQ